MDAAVLCEIRRGQRDSERTLTVAKVQGRGEYQRIEDS